MRRQIQKQLLAKIKHIYRNIESISIEYLSSQLQEMQNTFQSELSEKRYAFYGEILDGLILATTQITNNANTAEHTQVVTLIKELLNYIFAELMKETEIKKDIVFLPYKASMWDSLESIWIAANEDREHCNTYVIPIPYAERKKDQTVAQWHYEAALFPKYVPIVDWQKIDLEKMHPDVIFIHNPYDNCNSLTSVGSEYYASELKNYTDKLVYVPYFVLLDIKPGDEDLEEYMAHFITTKGVLYSDLVVVQSEDMRQIYINVLIRHTNQKDRRYWEQHIVGLGSPKYDKLLATKKEDIDIPQEWLKVIRKSDKNWKKIIIYNTGLQSMVSQKSKMIDKIDEIIQTFKAYKDEIALIWRPHPLVEAFTHELAPELNDRYQSILNTYKQEGWGIYDDTPDFDKSLILSDAFFGDRSSIAFLYKITGKPIFFNTLIAKEVVTKDNWFMKLFKITNACYEDDCIWCTAFHDPYLYKIDTQTGDMDAVIKIVDDPENFALYIYLFSTKDIFIFVPIAQNKLIIIDRSTLNKTTYNIPFKNHFNDNPNMKLFPLFLNGIIYNDNLYFWSVMYDGIIKFNLTDKQFSVIDDFVKDFHIKYFNEILTIFYYTKIEDRIFLPFANSNAVLEFSLKDESTILHYVGDDKQRYVSSAFDGEYIWLIPRNILTGKIIKWNPKNNIVKRYEDYPENLYQNAAYAFEQALRIDDYILVLSRVIPIADDKNYSDYVNLKINIKTDNVEAFKDCYKVIPSFGKKYSCVHLVGDIIFFIDGFDIIKYNFKANTFEALPIKPTKNVMKHIKQSVDEKLKFIFKPNANGTSVMFGEQKQLTLSHLIKFLINSDN